MGLQLMFAVHGLHSQLSFSSSVMIQAEEIHAAAVAVVRLRQVTTDWLRTWNSSKDRRSSVRYLKHCGKGCCENYPRPLENSGAEKLSMGVGLLFLWWDLLIPWAFLFISNSMLLVNWRGSVIKCTRTAGSCEILIVLLFKYHLDSL